MNGRIDTEDKYLSRGEAVETAALWKLWKNHSKEADYLFVDFSTSSHSAWKTLRKKQKRGEFSTVPTASAAGFQFRKPVSSRCSPTCALRRHTTRSPRVPGTGAGCKGYKPAARLMEYFVLDSPFHRTPIMGY